MTTLLLLMLGIALLLGGGDTLVRGASGLAERFGVPPVFIGLTVVAFGTSAPELVVNLMAILQNKGGLSFGNIIGSNLANLGLVLGLTALYQPLKIQGRIITREIPFMILATTFTVVFGNDLLLRNINSSYDRTDGISLLLLFSIFIYTMTSDVLKNRFDDPLLDQSLEFAATKRKGSMFFNIALTLGGLAGLIFGGQLTVSSASELARAMKIPETIIGLSLVAIGTSLPELVTSIIATWRGETDIAVGNVVGSNLFNLLFVLGITSTVRPVPVPEGGGLDIIITLTLSVALLPFCITGRRRLERFEGCCLLFLYLGYSIWRYGFNSQ